VAAAVFTRACFGTAFQTYLYMTMVTDASRSTTIGHAGSVSGAVRQTAIIRYATQTDRLVTKIAPAHRNAIHFHTGAMPRTLDSSAARFHTAQTKRNPTLLAYAMRWPPRHLNACPVTRTVFEVARLGQVRLTSLPFRRGRIVPLVADALSRVLNCNAAPAA
jgi:hypothetical protein